MVLSFVSDNQQQEQFKITIEQPQRSLHTLVFGGNNNELLKRFLVFGGYVKITLKNVFLTQGFASENEVETFFTMVRDNSTVRHVILTVRNILQIMSAERALSGRLKRDSNLKWVVLTCESLAYDLLLSVETDFETIEKIPKKSKGFKWQNAF